MIEPVNLRLYSESTPLDLHTYYPHTYQYSCSWLENRNHMLFLFLGWILILCFILVSYLQRNSPTRAKHDYHFFNTYFYNKLKEAVLKKVPLPIGVFSNSKFKSWFQYGVLWTILDLICPQCFPKAKVTVACKGKSIIWSFPFLKILVVSSCPLIVM